MPSRLVSSGGAEAAEFAESAGLVLDPWQRRLLDAGLGERADGRCAAQNVGIICPRQNGKNGTVEGAELYWLFLDPAVELITHTAHRFDTAQEHFRRLTGLIRETPDLLRQVKRINESHDGQEGIELLDGTRLLIKARAKGGGSGFSGDRIVFDEAWYLSDLGSMVPTLSARPDPQIWWLSSAPRPGVASDTLRRWIAEGRESSTIVYAEWSAPEGTDPDDRDAVAAANPGYGVRLDPEFVWGTERPTLTEEEWLRERLGIFTDPKKSVEWSLITEQVWTSSARAGGDGWLQDPTCLGLYVASDLSSASIVAAGPCRSGGRGFELVEMRERTEWLVDRVAEIVGRNRVSWTVVNSTTSAGVFVAALEAAGVRVLDCTGANELLADGAMFAGLCAGTIWHLDDPVLTGAAQKATPRKVGDRWAWDTRSSTGLLPLGAASLALWGTEQPAPASSSEPDFIVV